MADRYFTPAEVEALIPALTEIMTDVKAAQAEATAARERLHAEQERIAMSGGGVIDHVAWRQGKEELERVGQRIQARLEEIAELGGVPKDLEMGLVDFPHFRHGEVVNLCWKHGEQSIDYWHGMDEGYAKRKPL
ncbi:MAG: DUF2203 domain-containing protein [Gammaproteobacteria bacterium]